jgi:hypothetical protein
MPLGLPPAPAIPTVLANVPEAKKEEVPTEAFDPADPADPPNVDVGA